MLHSAKEPERRIQTALILVAVAILIARLSPTPFAAQIIARGRSGAAAPSQAMNGQANAVVEAGEVKARIALSDARAFSGQRVDVTVDFDIAPGWHVYGKPLPEEYTPTAVIFDKDLVSKQNLDFPKPAPVKFELLSATLPVYQGRFKAVGNLLLRRTLLPGTRRLGGTLSFQECNDNLCKMPQQVRFEIPLTIDSPPRSTPG